MTLKEKTKTYSFWISLISSVLLVAKTMAEQLGYTISDTLTTNIITGVCALMVLVGLFISPAKHKCLKELTADAENIIKEQEQTLEQIKKEVESAMDEQEKLSIEKQIEFLKEKLAQDEQKKEAEKQAEVEEKLGQEVAPAKESEVEVKAEVEEQPKAVEVGEEPHEEVVETDAEPAQNEKQVDYHELGLAELKQILQELLSRI